MFSLRGRKESLLVGAGLIVAAIAGIGFALATDDEGEEIAVNGIASTTEESTTTSSSSTSTTLGDPTTISPLTEAETTTTVESTTTTVAPTTTIPPTTAAPTTQATTTTVAPETSPTTTAAPTTQAPGTPTAAQWEALRQCESTGRYTVVSANGLYYGAYQFNRQTWDGVAARIGRADLVGVPPNEATPADQDAMALALWLDRGWQPWPTCGLKAQAV